MSTEDNLLRTLLILVAVIVFVPFLMMVIMLPLVWLWGGGHMWNGGMWNGGMWDGTGAMWLWPVMWLVVLALVVGVGYALYRGLRRSDDQRTDRALEELRIAYARGDLSDEEFEQRRERLRRDR